MKHVTAALVANGYPKRFVIDVGKPKRPAQQLSTTSPDATKGFCILPYIKGTSEPIKRILSNHDIKVAQKPHQTIGNLFPKPKDPVPKDHTRGAIYSIPCKDCGKSYIEDTKRKFSTRVKEHQKAVEHKHSQKSALAEHCLRSGHTVSWEASKILRTIDAIVRWLIGTKHLHKYKTLPQITKHFHKSQNTCTNHKTLVQITKHLYKSQNTRTNRKHSHK